MCNWSPSEQVHQPIFDLFYQWYIKPYYKAKFEANNTTLNHVKINTKPVRLVMNAKALVRLFRMIIYIFPGRILKNNYYIHYSIKLDIFRNNMYTMSLSQCPEEQLQIKNQSHFRQKCKHSFPIKYSTGDKEGSSCLNFLAIKPCKALNIWGLPMSTVWSINANL